MTYPGIQNTSILAAAGVARFQWSIVNSIGIPNGTATLALGADAGFALGKAVKEAGIAATQATRVFSTGDNGRTKYGWLFNATEIGELALNFGVYDMNFSAAGQGIELIEVGDLTAIGIQTNAPANAGQLALIANIDAQDADYYNGTARWLNFFVPLVAVTPNFGNHQEASPMDFPYIGQPTQTARLPWFSTIASYSATIGYSAATAFYATSPRYPLTQHVFRRDGSTTSFTLSYKPYGDHTNEQTFHVYAITSDGATVTKLTATTDYTVNLGTNTVTLVAAGTSGAFVLVVYEATNMIATV